MTRRSLPPQFATGLGSPEKDRTPLRDIVWDRPVFRAPALINPRVVFDPPPFRTQLFTAASRICRLARR